MDTNVQNTIFAQDFDDFVVFDHLLQITKSSDFEVFRLLNLQLVKSSDGKIVK